MVSVIELKIMYELISKLLYKKYTSTSICDVLMQKLKDVFSLSSGTQCSTWPQQCERADFSNKSIWQATVFCPVIAFMEMMLPAFSNWTNTNACIQAREQSITGKKNKNKTLFNQVGSCINLTTQHVQDQRAPNDWVSALETTSWSDLGRI